MDTFRSRLAALMLIVFAAGLMAGCGHSTPDDPKEVVVAMFGAMERDDKAALAHLLDLAELMKTANEDYALQSNDPRKFTNPQQILEDMTGDGKTKARWFAHQRIVNTVEVTGDIANVQVTFVDKEGSKGYMTKFGLHKVNDKWKIFSFRNVGS